MLELHKKKIIIVALAILIPLILSLSGVEVIEPGSSGVKKTLGKVEEKELAPGFYLYNPFTSSITEMDNKTQKGQGETEVYTKDVQQVAVSYVINYNLRPNASVYIYTQVGPDYESIVIDPVVNGILKNTIGKWDAIELVANRSKASSDIEAAISAELNKSGITVTSLQLTNIKFGREFEAAVEAKVTAVQKAEEAKNNTVQVREQASQRIIAAEADARAMQIQTAALKESQSLVMYEAVKKWNGVLPQIITGNGSNLLMQLPEAKDSK